ncbi:MAG: putative histidine kinase, classic [Ramlibacter sp.]|jgi:two-component system CAI-1 autoinducer sensor kinase/phosphatase CqsS|uniref:sensor histidine kinase n=1 Tax=Ramlibacter sp. TaxID=1917967 RepID=UPI00262500B2|nr:HAMP domain-containing sensor histidine kinase [Ramlibacter sp.]MDB5753540.1 putative histidine kinase, classic [Ramlibacter sp.]
MHDDPRRPLFAASPPRAIYESVAQRLRFWASTEVVRPLVEPILHPSTWRIRALGMTTMLGHPLFYLVWGLLLPQPYENLALRVVMAVLGLGLLVIPGVSATPPNRLATITFSIIFWLTLPWLFSWMYFCNSGNAVWLASLGAMFLIYYHLTDWRLATLGSISGLLVAWLMFHAIGPDAPPIGLELGLTNTVVLGFCWFMGLTLGLSSSNLRREQLAYTLGTMGIMAHELRTPLATMQLIGEALRNEAWTREDDSGPKLEKLALRLNNLVRNMNHQIDMQITNARLMRLPRHTELVSAAGLVQAAVADYPFRSNRERDSLVVHLHGDFRFRGSRALFAQVLDNLTKNALRSLAAATTAAQPGDLTIEVGAQGNRGRIVFSDKGVGMEPDLQARIFQPFFSTDRGTGHGLGLAFCQRVVQGAHGTIRVKSEPHRGAIFTIELPLA